MIVSIASMLIGSVGGVFQSSINRILAYSGIANIGFILSIHSLPLSNHATIIEFTSIYAIATIFTITSLFIIQSKTNQVPSTESLKGLRSKHPMLAFCLSVSLLSLGGIPPLAGFFAKFAIIKQLIQNNLIVLAIILVLTSAVLLFSYLKIIKNIYLDTAPKEAGENAPTPFILKTISFALIIWTLSYFAFEGTTFYTTIMQNANSIFYVF
jgi:NADH-quinone oxidoreductase subunit N